MLSKRHEEITHLTNRSCALSEGYLLPTKERLMIYIHPVDGIGSMIYFNDFVFPYPKKEKKGVYCAKLLIVSLDVLDVGVR